MGVFMALIKSDCKGVERFEGEANDCTVRALANASGMPYKLAHKIMAKAGRVKRQGMKADDWVPVLNRLGFTLESIHGTTNGAKYLSFRTGKAAQPGITLDNLLSRLGYGRFIIKIRGHVLAVVDGKVLDYGYNAAGSKVQAVFKLAKQAVSFN
jgi:hypothetical protein